MSRNAMKNGAVVEDDDDEEVAEEAPEAEATSAE
jgi:hypothetical protein